MSDWLDPIRAALDADRPLPPFFFRDDDAGWEHERFCDVLDIFASRGVPLDVAVIPAAMTADIARDLRNAAEALSGLIDLHQHGFSHTNHEANGRKAEFGRSRAVEDQRRDLREGRHRLTQMLGPSVRPIFTPPWNRCTTTTVQCLGELGFRVLSRDASAGLAGVPGLQEQPVRLDWCGKRGRRRGALAWGQAIANTMAGDAPVGIMLHHAVMERTDHEMLGGLLHLLSSDSRVRVQTMTSLSVSDAHARGAQ